MRNHRESTSGPHKFGSILESFFSMSPGRGSQLHNVQSRQRCVVQTRKESRRNTTLHLRLGLHRQHFMHGQTSQSNTRQTGSTFPFETRVPRQTKDLLGRRDRHSHLRGRVWENLLDDGFTNLCQRVSSKRRGTSRKATTRIEIKSVFTTSNQLCPRTGRIPTLR